MRNKPIRIALLGAESTGKTSLSLALTQALNAQGLLAVTVPEVLREWCDVHGRTPLAHEQYQIAKSQAERIFAVRDGWVIADTSSLMTAVYSDFIFSDKSLYLDALQHQSLFDLTLLMGLDVAWQPDGMQRDGAHVREPIDALIRDALSSAKVSYKVIYGQGELRLNAALMALQEHLTNHPEIQLSLKQLAVTKAQREENQFNLNRGKTVWRCELCSDAVCEHRLFSDLLKSPD